MNRRREWPEHESDHFGRNWEGRKGVVNKIMMRSRRESMGIKVEWYQTNAEKEFNVASSQFLLWFWEFHLIQKKAKRIEIARKRKRKFKSLKLIPVHFSFSLLLMERKLSHRFLFYQKIISIFRAATKFSHLMCFGTCVVLLFFPRNHLMKIS